MNRLALITLTLLASCTPRTTNGDGNPDAGTGGGCKADAECGGGQLCDTDGTCKACEVVLKLPAPNNVCLPKCGNDLGVGMPCTKGGGQCNHNDIHALFCTIDQVPDVSLLMCTGPCSHDSDCGSDAVCEGDPSNPGGPSGCVPAACSGEGEGEGEGEGAVGEGEGEGEGGQ